MSAQWPSAVVTTSTLYVAVNELQNNLSAGINSAVTTIGLNSTTSFPTVGLVLIDNEVIQYTGIAGNSLTGCTRAFDGTSAAAHSSGATVSFAFCAGHYNNAANEIIAVETYLNTVLGKGTTVTATEFGYLSGVTSAIQTQLGTLTTNVALKAPLASPTFTGTITTPLTASRAVTSNGSSQLSVSTCTAAELDFVHGVTSAIQTQLNSAATLPLAQNLTFTSYATYGVQGTATNNNAAAGNVGEYVSSVVSNVSLPSTGVVGDATSISLTAGDWDITALGNMNTAGTVTVGLIGVSTTSGNSFTGLAAGDSEMRIDTATGGSSIKAFTIASLRASLSGTTTYYFKMYGEYLSGSPKLDVRLSARRVR